MKKNETLLKIIKEKEDFLVSTHISLDGDALGSLISMGLLLKKLKKTFHLILGEKTVIPDTYNFLPHRELVEFYNPHAQQSSKSLPFQAQPQNEFLRNFAGKVFIALECPNLARLGNLSTIARKCGTLINIDHHSDNKKFGDINLIDERASSTCEILFFLSKNLGTKLDLEIATCLYTGIVTDTGRFQHANTSKTTFEVAKELLGLGVKPNEIFKEIYEKRSLAGIKLLGIILTKAKYVPEVRLLYSVVTEEDFLLTGTDMGITEDYVEFLRAVRDVGVAALLKETSRGDVKVSLRSKDGTNVSKIAAKFGGGGHKMASGYTSKMSFQETVNSLVEALRKS